MPITIETIKKATTNAPIIHKALASRAATDAASVGTAIFSLDSNHLIGKAMSMGRTNVPSNIKRSNERSLSKFDQPWPINKIITAAIRARNARTKKILAVDKPSVGVASGDVSPVGLAGAAVSPLGRVSA